MALAEFPARAAQLLGASGVLILHGKDAKLATLQPFRVVCTEGAPTGSHEALATDDEGAVVATRTLSPWMAPFSYALRMKLSGEFRDMIGFDDTVPQRPLLCGSTVRFVDAKDKAVLTPRGVFRFRLFWGSVRLECECTPVADWPELTSEVEVVAWRGDRVAGALRGHVVVWDGQRSCSVTADVGRPQALMLGDGTDIVVGHNGSMVIRDGVAVRVFPCGNRVPQLGRSLAFERAVGVPWATTRALLCGWRQRDGLLRLLPLEVLQLVHAHLAAVHVLSLFVARVDPRGQVWRVQRLCVEASGGVSVVKS